MNSSKKIQKPNRQKHTLSLIGLGVLVSVGAFSFYSFNKSSSQQIRQLSSEGVSAVTSNQAKIAAKNQNVQISKAGDASKEDSRTKNIEIEKELQAKDVLTQTQIQHVLAAFAEEQRKVFVSDEDRSQRQKRYSDPKILNAILKLLTEPARTDVEKRTQDLAGEFMVAAMENGSDLAFQTALEIMKASAFENLEIPRDSREQMAGVAGEIAYNFLAYRPRQQNQVQVALSGPVGQKIFENSVQLQTANLDESRTELAAQ